MIVSKFDYIFCNRIPNSIDEGMIYVCLECDIVIHKCACGCGEEVATPIDKTYGWTFFYDGEGISLYPSIGNWNYKCKSHYFINNSNVVWINKFRKSKNIVNKLFNKK